MVGLLMPAAVSRILTAYGNHTAIFRLTHWYVLQRLGNLLGKNGKWNADNFSCGR